MLGERELENCPHEVVRIHRKTNRWSRRIPVLLDIFEHCRGEYLFLLDGDDFWYLLNKIDLQIDALNCCPDQKICFTPAIVTSGIELNATGVTGRHLDAPAILSLDHVIRGDGEFMPTPSLCFRRQVFESAPPWLFGYVCVGDYPIQTLASYPGGAVYLPEPTSVYRTNVEGSWNARMNNWQNRLVFEVEFLELLHSLEKSIPGHKDAFRSVAVNHFNNFLSLSINNNDFQRIARALDFLKKLQ
jgi:hypothetical protein